MRACVCAAHVFAQKGTIGRIVLLPVRGQELNEHMKKMRQNETVPIRRINGTKAMHQMAYKFGNNEGSAKT